MVATKLNLVRDLFSTNPKANVAPRITAVAAGMTSAPVTTIAAALPARTTTTAPVVTPVAPSPPAAGVAPASAAAKVDAAKPITMAPVAPVATVATDSSADVLNTVNKWARDWAGKNPDGYLAAYAKSFKPEDGSSRSAWNAARRERITTPKRIKVEVLGATVEMTSATEAKVTFRQAYSSDALQTRSRKTLTLVKEGGTWLIARERVG